MSAPKSQRRYARSRRPPRKRGLWRRPWRLIAGVIFLLALAFAVWPKPHGWQPLGPGMGRIRWVETRTDSKGDHPLAPGWIRSLRRAGIPWPTDLPLEPLGASFGGGGQQTSAWYLVQSAKPSQQLWHVDKSSLRITDAHGAEVEWPGGTGSVLVDSRRRLQLLYIGVPPHLAHKGARVRFQLARFAEEDHQETKTGPVELPF